MTNFYCIFMINHRICRFKYTFVSHIYELCYLFSVYLFFEKKIRRYNQQNPGYWYELSELTNSNKTASIPIETSIYYGVIYLCQAFSSGAVTTCFYDLGLSRPGIEPRSPTCEANALPLRHRDGFNVYIGHIRFIMCTCQHVIMLISCMLAWIRFIFT